MRVRILFGWVCCLLFPVMTVVGQESICGDGIDNDGDGRIDCYDGDCAGRAACDGFFVVGDDDCSIPATGLTYSLTNTSASSNRNVHTQARIALGDVDSDGIPDVIAPHAFNEEINLLWGGTGPGGEAAGTTKAQISTSEGADRFRPELEVMTADIDGDGCAEIFTIERAKGSASGNDFNGSYHLAMYTCDLSSRVYRVPLSNDRPGIFGIADFDGDGRAEVYLKNMIVAAENGVILINQTGNWETEVNSAPVAVDISASSNGLELVVGGSIFGVNNLTNRNIPNSGTLTQIDNLPQYFVKNQGLTTYSSTSVGDVNQDGNLDVVITGASNSIIGPTTVFFWDVANGTFDTFQPANNWLWGTGRISIADVTGNGLMNLVFATGNLLYTLELDGSGQLQEVWSEAIVDGQSGIIGVTPFDFDNDGILEIVYRDEGFLTIRNGEDGSVLQSTVCQSHTLTEYPIIADVNGDGRTNICVPCNFSDNTNDFNINDGLQEQGDGTLRIYEASGENWVPTRALWNQHGYHVVNINNDLTIPINQQDMTVVWSSNVCRAGQERPLNAFMAQTPNISLSGCPLTPGADIAFLAIDSLSSVTDTFIAVAPPTCPGEDFEVSYQFINDGDIGITDNLLVTYYQGNPRLPGATKLGTDTLNLVNFLPDDTLVVNGLSITGNGGFFELFVVLNDDGLSTLPITLPTTDIIECGYLNNIASVLIEPAPFTVTAELVQDNNKCTDSLPDNGAARAYVIIGTDSLTAGHTFFWWEGDSAIGSPDFTGNTFTGLGDGNYVVVAQRDAQGCFSDTATVTIGRIGLTPDITINKVAPFTNCATPDGALSAEVEGMTSGYAFEWFEGNITGPLIAAGPDATGLDAISYAVFVTDLSSGCQNIRTETVDSDVTIPIIFARTVVNITSCAEPEAGVVTADVAGDTAQFVFRWYDGDTVKTTADFIGATYGSLGVGTYTVTAEDTVSSCPSSPFMVTIGDLSLLPIVTALQDQPQSSCVASLPNGQATATAITSGGEPLSGYSFSWFEGDNTLSSNQVSTTSGVGNQTAEQLQNILYTVEVINLDNQCKATDTISISEQIADPVPDVPTITPLTLCSSPNGTASATVGGATAGFDFYWYDGIVGALDSVNADFKGALYTGLDTGVYTVFAVDQRTRCFSSSQLATVVDSILDITTSITAVAQTSCIETAPNGSLTVDQSMLPAGNEPASYSYAWYAGQFAPNSSPAGTVISSDSIAQNLARGTYTVFITNDDTGCDYQAEGMVTDALVEPVLDTPTATALTSCSSPNGTASATVSGLTAGFDFYWYAGVVGSPDSTAAVFTGPTFTGLDSLTFTVFAADQNTRCFSAPATVTVGSNIPEVTVALSKQDQVSCLASTPQGEITATPSTLSGNTNGYSFRWFSGLFAAGSSPAGSGLSANSTTVSSTASGLAAGSYTVFVVNLDNSCERSDTISIVELQNDPVLDPIITQALTSCAPANGIANATVGSNSAGFDFYWYNGTVGTADTTAADFKGPSYTGLDTITVSVFAVDQTTRCISTAETATIGNNIAATSLNITEQEQISCDPGNPLGQIISSPSTVGGNTAGYDFSWYTGTLTSFPASPGFDAATAQTADTVSNLFANNYTLVVTNLDNGCGALGFADIIEDQTDIPVLDPVNTTDLTSCISPDGTATATATGGQGTYTFLWYEGVVGSPDTTAADFSGPTYSGLDSIQFTVFAVDAATRCISESDTVKINPDIPTVNIPITVQNQLSCVQSSPLGELTATPSTIGGNTAGYSFRWFQGTVTPGTSPGGAGLPASSTTNSSTLSNLEAAVYTLFVVNQDNGCESSASEVIVEDQTNIPVLDTPTPVALSNCDPANLNSSISASATGGLGVYDFYWFDGIVGSADTTSAAFRGTTYSGLALGDYTVFAVDRETRCVSLSQDATILSAQVFPDISLTKSEQSSCDLNSPNGRFLATASMPAGPEPAGGYRFDWYRGANTLAANQLISATVQPGTTGLEATGLARGIYRVVVRNEETFCESSLDSLMTENISQPGITATNTQAQDDCALPNGELQANGTGGSGNYDFYWFDGNRLVTEADTSSADFVGQTYQNLVTGTYTVILADQQTRCISDTAVVEVAFNPVSVTQSIVTSTLPADCDQEGSFELTVTTPNTAGYEASWFVRIPPAGNFIQRDILASGVTQTVNTANANITVLSGPYSVLLTNLDNGCTDTVSFNLPFANAHSASLIADTPDSTCLSEGSGTARVEVNTGTSGLSSTDFNFVLFNGRSTTPIDAVDTLTISNPAITEVTFTGLAAGDYTAVVFQSTTPFCPSDPVFITIDAIASNPLVNLAFIRDDDFCDPLSGNGSRSAAIDESSLIVPGGAAETSGYTYEWYRGNDPTIGVNRITSTRFLDPLTPFTIDSLKAGQYLLVVTDTSGLNRGCTSSERFSIADSSKVLQLLDTDLVLTDQTFCTPNGEIEINSVTEDGSTVSFDPTGFAGGPNYTFELFDANGSTLITAGVNPFSNRNGQTYFVRATNARTACASDLREAVLEDLSTNPVLNFSNLQAQTSCDSLSPTGLTGALTANVQEADGSTDTYSFNWTFAGFPNPSIANAASNSQLTLARSGTYAVTATNTLTGCTVTGSETIPLQPADPSLDLLSFTDDRYCVGGIGDASLEGIPNSTSYTYQWYQNTVAIANLIPGETANAIDSLDAGVYFAIGRRTDNFCFSDPLRVEIGDISADPVAFISDIVAQTSCDPTSPIGLTGALLAQAGEQAGTAEAYAFNWTFPGTPNPAIIATDTTNALSDALQGEYLLSISNNITGCTATARADVPFIANNPNISLVSTIDDALCSDGNGEITVSGSPGSTTYAYIWYNTSVDPANVIAGETGATLDSLSNGTYFVTARRDDNFCESPALQAIINDISTDPVVIISNVILNTSCDPANPDGGLLATTTEADGSTGTYTYGWTFPGSPAPTITNVANTSQLSAALDGDYSVLVTNSLTGCTVSGNQTIGVLPDNPVISFVRKADDAFCVDGNGEIEVTAAPISTSYTYTWFQDTISAVNVILNENTAVLDSVDVGNYVVIAQRDDNLCRSEAITVTVNDISLDPVLRFSGFMPQTSCDSLSPAGLTGELIANAAEQDGTTNSYDFVWTFPASPSPVIASTDTTSALTEAVQGTYSVRVTNTLNGCSISGSRAVLEEITLPTISLVEIVNDAFCGGGNGSVEVAGNPAIGAGYTYQWYAGAVVPGTELSNTGSTLPAIADGSYFVSAIRNDNFCASEIFQADVRDISSDPILTFENAQAQTACDLNSPIGANGRVTARVIEADSSASFYTYNWSAPGIAPLITNSGNTSTISRAQQGAYRVDVNNIVTNCTVSGAFVIEEDFPDIVVPNNGILITDQTACVPADGEARVIRLTEDGLAVAPASSAYRFDWFTADGSTAIVADANPFSNQVAGDYVLVVSNTGSLCTSRPISFTIEDFTAPPVIDILELRAQTSCDPTRPNGIIRAFGDGQTDASGNYNFSWYRGIDTTGVAFANVSTISNLAAGPYTVSVENRSTGCTTTALNTLGEQIELPRLTISAEPLTSCIENDGSILATVANPVRGGSYRFEWFTNTDTTLAPIYTGPNIDGLTVGAYVVVAIEQDVNFCRSETFSINVRDNRIFPQVIITEDAPLSNCDPTLPNGQLTASTNGSVADHAFEWFDGGQPFDSVINIGTTLTGLTNQEYSVVITNTVSGCSNFGSRVLSTDFPTVPLPDVVVVSNLTNCIEPDGRLTVSVGGNTGRYLFDWYNGGTVGSTADNTGPVYEELDLGSYTVTATDIFNGCISAPNVVEILDERVFPEFVLNITPEQCEQMNGSALVNSTEENVQFREIVWSNGVLGPLNENLASGFYTVTVTAVNDCVVEQDFEVPLDIFEYNGLSLNGDNQNDIFEIACIDSFPNNTVRIFNRSGQMIYEGEGYDNNTVVFDGTSNRGITLLGDELPDGTYFYIIDKRDGSKPVTGYLELLR